MSGGRALIRDENGFSLVELLAAMAIGSIVMLAGWAVVDASATLSGDVTARTDTVQRARIATEAIARPLRSQACPTNPVSATDTAALASAAPNAVSFYAVSSFADAANGSSPRDDLHRITYDPAAGTITDRVWRGPGVAFPPSGQPSITRVLASKAEAASAASGGNVLFRYYAYSSATPPQPTTELTSTPLSAADRKRVVRITVALKAEPDFGAGSSEDRLATTVETDVFARRAEPSRPEEGPGC